MSPTSADHGSRIARALIRSLIAPHIGALQTESPAAPLAEPVEFGSAIGVLHTKTAWVLLTKRHDRGLGPALLWAKDHDASALRLMTRQHAGDLSRRATLFRWDIHVYDASTGTLALASPSPVPTREISFADELFTDLISAAGADVTREHGVLTGEVCGLEVCRVVHDESGDARLEIGVGIHDRETFQLLHGRTATLESLCKVVSEVASKRVVGAQPHPLNQLGRERILRHLLCASPHLVEATVLEPAPPPIPRENVKDPVPCVARGISRDGSALVVVCSVGVDPDLVAFGADARQQIDSTADLVFVSPQRDVVQPIVQLAEMLHRPARFCGINLLDVFTHPED